MAQFTKLQTLTAIAQTGMVPVFYHKDVQTAMHIVKACYQGGVRAFEFTNRGDFAHEVFAQLVKYAACDCPDMILGAGSVVDAPTAALYIQLGACFIVGPCMNTEVAKVCNRRLIPYSPGCGSVTEIGMAQELGCDLCKLFPAGNVGGPSFVKNVMGPMPWSMLMVTGGVEPTKENLTAWAKAGVTAVGMGSNLFPPQAIQAQQWDEVTRLCRLSLDAIAQARL